MPVKPAGVPSIFAPDAVYPITGDPWDGTPTKVSVPTLGTIGYVPETPINAEYQNQENNVYSTWSRWVAQGTSSAVLDSRIVETDGGGQANIAVGAFGGTASALTALYAEENSGASNASVEFQNTSNGNALYCNSAGTGDSIYVTNSGTGSCLNCEGTNSAPSVTVTKSGGNQAGIEVSNTSTSGVGISCAAVGVGISISTNSAGPAFYPHLRMVPNSGPGGGFTQTGDLWFPSTRNQLRMKVGTDYEGTPTATHYVHSSPNGYGLVSEIGADGSSFVSTLAATATINVPSLVNLCVTCTAQLRSAGAAGIWSYLRIRDVTAGVTRTDHWIFLTQTNAAVTSGGAAPLAYEKSATVHHIGAYSAGSRTFEFWIDSNGITEFANPFIEVKIV